MNKANKKLFIIIDASAVFHRAYHALPRFTTKRGELVNAVYGSALILLKVLKEFKPAFMVAAFDVKGPTFRDKKYKEYKATRKKAPDELYAQIPRIKELFGVFNIPIYEKQGFEADDVIGTVVEKLKKEKDIEALIVSGDLDTLQLVADDVRVYTMRKGMKDTIIYDKKAVKERFGITPYQVVDYKGLRGDSSDNIPGVPGVGEKTASNLIKNFGSIEKLYEEIKKGEQKGISEKMRQNLLENKKQAEFSKMLATIRMDVPFNFDLKDAAWGGFDPDSAKKLFQELNFTALIQRLTEIEGFENLQIREVPSGMSERKYELLEQVEHANDAGILSDKVYKLEKDLVDIIIKMERSGIGIDKQALSVLEKEMGGKLANIEKKIYKFAGQNFNINSPAQVCEILFEKLGISTKGVKKTKGGKISTAAGVLEKLKGEHKIIDLILQQRELQKLLSTYIKPLGELADSESRIHTTFKSLGTTTGRMSSNNPNLQNIPIRGEWGAQIRQAFRAERGKKFLICDYSQIELRITAHLSQDKNMIDAFRNGEDIHTNTAAYIFGVDKEKVDVSMRRRAKALNFGIIYGIGPHAFAASADISFEEAREFIQRYFDVFEKVEEYMESTKQKAHQQGYVETILGRKRFLPDLQSPNPMLRSMAERAAINMPAQGSAADIVKMAMVETDKKLKNVDLLLQIHDELIWEGTDEAIKEAAPQAQEILENVVKLDAPLRVDYFIGDTWDAK